MFNKAAREANRNSFKICKIGAIFEARSVLMKSITIINKAR